jgi:chromosome segregation ATPase
MILTSNTLECELEELEERKNFEKFKKFHDTTVREHQLLRESSELLEKDISDSTALISVKNFSIKNLQESVGKLQKDFAQDSVEKEQQSTMLQELNLRAENIQTQIESEVKEKQLLENSLLEITENCQNLETKLADCESKTKTTKGDFELNVLATQEKNNSIRDGLIKIQNEIQETEKIFGKRFDCESTISENLSHNL